MNQTQRRERKYFLEGTCRSSVEIALHQHPAHFREIYQEREIHSLYFDTVDLSDLTATLAGNPQRQKVRIRWYDQLFGEISPTLELKHKIGTSGTKERLDLPQITVTRQELVSTIMALLENLPQAEHMREIVYGRQPTVIISYHRKYYQTMCRNFRITIDWNLKFHHVHGNILQPWQPMPAGTLVELKYDVEHDEQATQIADGLNMRLTRHSKYTRGLIGEF